MPPSHTDNAPLVLTIDIGSSSLRTNLFTAAGHQLERCEAQLEYEVRVTPDGGVEIEPEALLERIFSAVDTTLACAGKLAGQVAGVGVCSLVSNVMGINAKCEPTTPIYTWADTRNAAEAADLRATLDEAAIHQRTGCPIHSSYLPPRLLWLRRTVPQAYTRTERWISMGDWLQLRLFGQMAQSLSVASWSGLLNRHTLDWDEEWLRYLDLPREKLPPLADADAPMRGLGGEYATRWPQLRDVPWFPCVGDGAGGNVGSGCWGEEALAVQVGTSGAMRALLPGDVGEVPQGLWLYRLTRDEALLGGALSEGGNLLAWLRATLNVADWSALERDAAGLAPDSHGLTLLPFIAGERSPGWNPAVRATISGLSLSTRPVDIVRAAQEAVAYRFGLIYVGLREMLPPPNKVVASGGALLNSPGWVSMLADVLGVPVTASGEQEASSKGTAMLTLRSLGLISDFGDVPVLLGETYSPDAVRHEVYTLAIERQRKLYEALER